jgi:hypothetical protein
MDNNVLWLIVTGPNGDQKIGSGPIGEEEAKRQLALVYQAIQSGGMIDLPWLVTRASSVIAAYTAGARG